jgi:hypothetical protein
MSHHFCIRAVVTAPGDPNTDNKRVLSNFGNIQVKFGRFVDIDLIRRNIDLIHPHEVRLDVIPRLAPGLEISSAAVAQAKTMLEPGEARREKIRLVHRPLQDVYQHRPIETVRHDDPCGEMPRLDLQPDPLGRYAIDDRTLPPGLSSKTHSFVTLVQSVGGLPQGGVTLLVQLQSDEH